MRDPVEVEVAGYSLKILSEGEGEESFLIYVLNIFPFRNPQLWGGKSLTYARGVFFAQHFQPMGMSPESTALCIFSAHTWVEGLRSV